MTQSCIYAVTFGKSFHPFVLRSPFWEQPLKSVPISYYFRFYVTFLLHHLLACRRPTCVYCLCAHSFVFQSVSKETRSSMRAKAWSSFCISPEFLVATHRTVLALKIVFNSEYKKESKKEGIKKKKKTMWLSIDSFIPRGRLNSIISITHVGTNSTGRSQSVQEEQSKILGMWKDNNETINIDFQISNTNQISELISLPSLDGRRERKKEGVREREDEYKKGDCYFETGNSSCALWNRWYSLPAIYTDF